MLQLGLGISWDFDIDYQEAKTDWLAIRIGGSNEI